MYLGLLSVSPPFSLPPLLCGWQRWARAAARSSLVLGLISYSHTTLSGGMLEGDAVMTGGSHENTMRL